MLTTFDVLSTRLASAAVAARWLQESGNGSGQVVGKYPGSTTHAEDHPSRDARQLRILLIEDEPDLRTLYRAWLERRGFVVHEAESAETGLTLAVSQAPDLIVLDLALPDLDGTEVLNRIRMDASLDQIPVVVVSKWNHRATYSAKPTAFLSKPVTEEDFCTTLQETLTNRRTRVLLIDDDDDIRALLAANLEELGCVVHASENGARGLAALRSFQPHVILLDLMMPEMDGYEVLSAIRRDPDFLRTPIIIQTAGPPSHDQQQRVHVLGAELMQKHNLFNGELTAYLDKLRRSRLA